MENSECKSSFFYLYSWR